MRLPHLLVAFALGAAGLAVAALPLADAEDAAGALLVPQDAPELDARAGLRARLASTPHTYFRFVNARFLRLVCTRYAALLSGARPVTLHGDPHLEQYAVTDRGRGLTDFDDSTTGPALLDLARFATSIRLAARERNWPGADQLIAALTSGYREALRAPGFQAPEPGLVRRLRADFDRDRMACLVRAEALMEALPAAVAPSDATLQRAGQLLAAASGWPEPFFRVKRFGALDIGIGSAATEKYLLRIEGPTSLPGDDVILEVKEVRPLPVLECLRSQPGPTRILAAQSRLAYEPFEYVGGLTLEGHPYWFHAWPDNYAELSIGASLASAEELREVAFDVGVQLGRGHPKPARGRHSEAPRRALLKDLERADLAGIGEELASATEAAWERFRKALNPPEAPK